MIDTRHQNPLRLRKKHGTRLHQGVSSADGQRLINAQSLRSAIVASLIVIIVFSILWIALTSLLNQIFPWMTVVLGFLLGFAIRLAGRGVDWRFPLLASILAIAGSLASNIVVAASVTAEAFGTGTLQVLQSVTAMTWPVFFDEVWNIADAFFAIVGAGLAAFFANRRLSRAQYFALRLWKQEHRNGG
jgi:hypothetical protein